ncbi:MAG: MaoC/PaaZ C-terminal domain-containing protein [Candidatus Binatia bacterium]|nr:MaoC/PaaZ C-terminal domain-containing protein [Candidatus Binatia bacterium]
MPIDRDKALAHEFEAGDGGYSKDNVILYHLGVGAGVPATDASELEYTYEKRLKVLPSFTTVANSGASAKIFSIPGLEFNRAMMLHGEQEVEIHKPLPPETKLRGKTKVADIYDKGKAALLLLETAVTDEAGDALYTNRMSLFLRGEGGFGGPKGPEVSNAKPDRAPDGVVESTTLPQQALLYRLNGDKNPLHCDPDFAAKGGFDRPIIHGLCSYGIVCKAVVDGVLGGDPTKVAKYSARFRGIAFPGETYLTSFWKEGDTILVEAKSKERDAVIISNAVVTVRS